MLWASLKTRMSFIAPLKSISDPCRTVKRIEKIVISVELKYYFAAKIRDHDLTRQSLKNTEMEFWHPEEKWSFGSPTKYVSQPTEDKNISTTLYLFFDVHPQLCNGWPAIKFWQILVYIMVWSPSPALRKFHIQKNPSRFFLFLCGVHCQSNHI